MVRNSNSCVLTLTISWLPVLHALQPEILPAGHDPAVSSLCRSEGLRRGRHARPT